MITKEQLICELNQISHDQWDFEREHVKADELLLSYIDDEEVTIAYNKIRKWYA